MQTHMHTHTHTHTHAHTHTHTHHTPVAGTCPSQARTKKSINRNCLTRISEFHTHTHKLTNIHTHTHKHTHSRPQSHPSLDAGAGVRSKKKKKKNNSGARGGEPANDFELENEDGVAHPKRGGGGGAGGDGGDGEGEGCQDIFAKENNFFFFRAWAGRGGMGGGGARARFGG